MNNIINCLRVNPQLLLKCEVCQYFDSRDESSSKRILGLGLVDHSQEMTVAARVTAEKKAVGQRL